MTDDGHSINPVRQKCRLIALATGTIGLNLRPPGRSRRAPVARPRRGLLDVLLVRVDALHPATHVRPLARHSTLRSVPRYRLRFLGQCQHTDWIRLCRAMLDRPVGTYGDNVQWAASGGHPLTVPMRLHSLHPYGTATHVELFCGCEWRPPIHSPRVPPLASGAIARRPRVRALRG